MMKKTIVKFYQLIIVKLFRLTLKTIFIVFSMIVLVVLLRNCVFNGKKEVNSIEFVNSIEDVTDSLSVLKGLVSAMPIDNRIESCFIDSDNNDFVVNNQRLGKWNKVVNDTDIISGLSKKYHCGFSRIIFLINYLNMNYISGFFFDVNSNLFDVPYKEQECGDRSEDKRSLMFKEDYNLSVQNDYYKIETKGRLVLVKMSLSRP